MRSRVGSVVYALARHTGCTEEQIWRIVQQMIEVRYPTVSSTSTEALAPKLADPPERRPILLDARSPEEYAVSHLPGARHVNPAADSIPNLATLPADDPIVIYCSVGSRSARIAHQLQTQGVSNVSNLKGSIFRWATEGRPVVRNGTHVRAVHPYDARWGTLLDDSLHCHRPAECAR